MTVVRQPFQQIEFQKAEVVLWKQVFQNELHALQTKRNKGENTVTFTKANKRAVSAEASVGYRVDAMASRVHAL